MINIEYNEIDKLLEELLNEPNIDKKIQRMEQNIQVEFLAIHLMFILTIC